MVQNGEWKNAEWDKMSNEERWMVQNVE
jgi:hypothetical protein